MWNLVMNIWIQVIFPEIDEFIESNTVSPTPV